MSISSSQRPPYLRLISSREKARNESEHVDPKYVQPGLFFGRPERTLIFLELDHLSPEDLVSVLTDLRPRIVLDLRRVPRFDIGHLNRRTVFHLFDDVSAKYFDLSGALASVFATNEEEYGARVSELVKTTLFKEASSLTGPVCFAIDSVHGQVPLVYEIARLLDSPRAQGWDILLAPAESPEKLNQIEGRSGEERSKSVVFISHANPEDNDFVLWLSAQLQRLGYEVWSDVTNLKGGDPIWESVERIIRERASRVIVVLSKNSQNSAGVLDEVNLAITLERAERLSHFVIPIRLDEVPFHSMQLNLLRKNILDFSRSWALGLKSLVQALMASHTPRAVSALEVQRSWVYRAQAPNVVDFDQEEELASNWFPVLSCPPSLFVYQSQQATASDPGSAEIVPYVRIRDLMLCFLPPSEIHSFGSDLAETHYKGTISFRDLANGSGAHLVKIASADGRRMAANLIRQATLKYFKGRGLRPYGMMRNRQSWYVPAGLLQRDEVVFVDLAGAAKRKKLVGRSERRNVYWHYAVQPRIMLEWSPRVALRSTIVFSEDGRTPLNSIERQHQLRRSFCRSWWNDRWRDLLLAFTDWLANGTGECQMSVNATDVIRWGCRPITFNAPVKLCDHAPISYDDAADDIYLGELDEEVDEFLPDEET